MPKKSIDVRSMGGGKYEVSAGSSNGLAVHDGSGWTLSPNLRSLPEDTEGALLKRLSEAHAVPGAKQG